MYVITGATGHTGSMIVNRLLEAGKAVRVVGRSQEKLQPLVTRGAEAFVGDLTDAEAMTRAFAGAAAVYALLPPVYVTDLRANQNAVGAALAAAIERAGVKYVVSLSGVGAHVPEAGGPAAGLRAFEDKLNRIPGLAALHLRAGYFFENHLRLIPAIKQMDRITAAFRADASIPMIATRDIGARAADELMMLNFTGHASRELLGPRDYMFSDVAAILGKAVGRPNLSYMQAPYAMVEQTMIQMGMSQSTARLLNEMARGFNDGVIKAQEPRSAGNTTRTELEQFAQEVFAPAFQGKAAGA